MEAGLDSLSGVELVNSLGSTFSTELEPTALFDYPTVGGLSQYLTGLMGAETDVSAQVSTTQVDRAIIDVQSNTKQCHSVTAYALTLPIVEDSSDDNGDLRALSSFVTCKNVPLARWDMEQIDTGRFYADAAKRIRYGSFLETNFAAFDNIAFRISPGETVALEP